MDRPEPKPSLLDDQPFLDRLSELDRQLDNESDGKRGPSGPGGKRKLLPAFREEEKAEPAAPEAPPVAQPPAASRPPAPVVHEPEILEAPAWSVEPTPAPVPPRPPVLPQEAVRPRRAPAPEPGPGVAGAAAGRTSPEADRAPVPDDADRLRPLEEEEEESPDGVLTYETFFGLNEKPFSLGSDPRFFYSSESHHVAFQAMLAAIRRREGIVVATGDVGMGKTTLCRTVIAHLDRKTFAAFIHDPFLSIEDLLKRLLVDFGVVASRDVTSGHLANTSRHDLTLVLHEFLRSLVALDAYAVVIIDEAQKLSAGLLEDIRLLCDLDGPGKLLQTVLIGQPSLLERLLAPEMRALDQRITVRCALKPLGREEIAPYVSHRLAVAGGSVTFTADATDVVHAVSGGVPRVINL
ncbi:MAG TPA: AAA family ATPase, partial [Vicinamibacterales bacterium]|nr:AAA family ATPase [Vicinamibacterales bacterium]